MKHRGWWLTMVGLAACIAEAPGLPEMTGHGSGGSTGPVGECGNGEREAGEECDGVQWQGATCQSLGFFDGVLACAEDCTFDTSGCHMMCGNGVLDEGEECEGGDLGGQSCESLVDGPGNLTCTVGCTYDADGCAPGMVDIPGGVFTMGSNPGEGSANEEPQRQVQVDAFYIDQTEVTVLDYAVCVAVGMCLEPDAGGSCNWGVAGREDHPVNCVDWDQAEDYCAWAGGGTKRLPTEAEWEKAARGTDVRVYPWGDSPAPSCSHVVMEDAAADGEGCGNNSTMEVGSKPQGASPYGAQDMAGNVYEWVSDWYGGYDAGATYNPTGPAMGTSRVVRGGSWGDFSTYNFRAADRYFFNPSYRFGVVGFRCARTPPAAQ